MWTLFIIFFLPIQHGDALLRKRVCVIGAGRSGLAALKLVADQIQEFEPVAFERNSDVGGLWIYRESPDFDEHGLPLHSGIYENLRTNIPKDRMVYPDYLDFNGREFGNYVSHEMVLEYIRNYTDHFEIRKYIQFNTLVTKVMPIEGNGTWRTETWRLETKNLKTNEKNETICHAVLVCSGHFSKPNIPNIPGLETFPGQVFHSRAYRRPENYTNRTVVLLGAGASGLDISRDLSKHAKTIYLSHKSNFIKPSFFPKDVFFVRGVVGAKGSELILQDNTTIVADTFIFCTGYLYEFSFIDESSGIIVDKKSVSPLYRESINKNHPSMAFIGLVDDIYYGTSYYLQSAYFLGSLLEIEKVMT